MKCLHTNFYAKTVVDRIVNDDKPDTPASKFQANISIICDDCKTPFRFIGLPCGVDLNGASVSIDGQEGRFAIAPKGEVLSELEGGDVGFTVRKTH